MSAKLHALQRDMQAAIVSGARDVNFACGTDVIDTRERLQIYVRAYRLRLREALAENFPALQSVIGAERFAAVAGQYIDAYPSTRASIRDFGSRLAEQLTLECADEPWLAELADIEWRLGCAFDAADESPLRAEQLATLRPEQWASLRFRFAASVARLNLRTNAVDLYAAWLRDDGVSVGKATQATRWLIWRQETDARYRRLERNEALAFDALSAGESFSTLCERLFEVETEQDVPLVAAASLKRWIADGLIVTFSIEA